MLVGQSIEDTLAYYRAAIQTKYRAPQLADVFARLNNKITVPTRILCGQQDMRKEMLPRAADLFTANTEYQWHEIENSGHFLHREQPDIVNDEILRWITQ